MSRPIFILCAAGRGLMIDAQRPISLIKFADKEYLYEKQIYAIRSAVPNAHIIYITGFNCDKIDNRLKSLDCSIIHNFDYDETSAAYSFYLATKNLNCAAYLIYGNLLFNTNTIKTIKNLSQSTSNSILFTNPSNGNSQIGVGPNGLIDWCFSNKWTKCCFLSNEDIELYNKISEKLGPKRFLFEIINELTNITSFVPKELTHLIKEVSRIKDIKAINKELFSNDCSKKISYN